MVKCFSLTIHRKGHTRLVGNKLTAIGNRKQFATGFAYSTHSQYSAVSLGNYLSKRDSTTTHRKHSTIFTQTQTHSSHSGWQTDDIRK